MREKARDKGRLEDILEYSNNVSKLIEGISYEQFTNDIRTYYAVMKNVEIVGEAAYMLSKEFKDSHNDTQWNVVQGMRHFLVPETLYDTAITGIPELRQQVERYLAETDWQQWEQSDE